MSRRRPRALAAKAAARLPPTPRRRAAAGRGGVGGSLAPLPRHAGLLRRKFRSLIDRAAVAAARALRRSGRVASRAGRPSCAGHLRGGVGRRASRVPASSAELRSPQWRASARPDLAERPAGRDAAAEPRAGARGWQNAPRACPAVWLARPPGNEEETRGHPVRSREPDGRTVSLDVDQRSLGRSPGFPDVTGERGRGGLVQKHNSPWRGVRLGFSVFAKILQTVRCRVRLI